MSNWHDATCSRPDVGFFHERQCCLSCGSMLAEARDILPSSDGKYVYPPLQQRSETRLVCLQPGNLADPIKCDIVIGRLEDLPKYEAISYTWADETGDSTKCRMIYLESCPYLITSNCEAALKRIRLRSICRMIWMDAISINQDSKEELGHQLKLMPEIYARALRVVVYIGEAEDDSDIVLDHLNGSSLESFPETALRRLLARRYFSRVWVIQEVALARQAILICGSTTVPWSCLTLDNPTARRMLGRVDPIPLPPVIHFNAPRYKDLDHLPALLDIARPCKALDPRDKVFALIGLIVGAQVEGLVADYTLTVEKVYTDVAASIARRAGCLAVMSRVSLTSGLPGLPSWVPDWTSPGHFQSGVTTLNDPKPAFVDKLQGMLTIFGIETDKLSVLSYGFWSTAKGFDVSLEGNAQLGDVLYQICNTDNKDELHQQDPYWFAYPRYQEMVFDDLNNDLRNTFVLREHFSNQFKIVGRCRLLRTHSGAIWTKWKGRREMEKKMERPNRDWEKKQLLKWREEEWGWMKQMKEWEWERQKQWEEEKQLQEWPERTREWEKQLSEWRKKEQEWNEQFETLKKQWEKEQLQEWPEKKRGWEKHLREWPEKKQLQEWPEKKRGWEKHLREWPEKKQLQEWPEKKRGWKKQLREWREMEQEWEEQFEMREKQWEEEQWKEEQWLYWGNKQLKKRQEQEQWENEKQLKKRQEQEQEQWENEKQFQERQLKWEMEKQLTLWQKKEWQWEKQLMEWREKEWEWEKQLAWAEKKRGWVKGGKQLTEWREKEWEWEKWKEWRTWTDWEKERAVKKIEII